MIVYFGFTGIILYYTCSYNCFDKADNRKYESLKVHIYNVSNIRNNWIFTYCHRSSTIVNNIENNLWVDLLHFTWKQWKPWPFYVVCFRSVGGGILFCLFYVFVFVFVIFCFCLFCFVFLCFVLFFRLLFVLFFSILGIFVDYHTVFRDVIS
jgi:hypothetical protein